MLSREHNTRPARVVWAVLMTNYQAQSTVGWLDYKNYVAHKISPTQRRPTLEPKIFKICATKKIVDKLLYGSLQTDRYYDFVCKDEDETVLVDLDTTAPVGPVSGKSNWVIRVHPHPRAQEIAEAIWDELELSEVPEDAIDPADQDCTKVGWYCVWIVKIHY